MIRKPDNPAKHFILAFVIAIVLYVVTYGWIEHRRNRKGPWQVTFSNNSGAPAMIINQPWLGLTNVTLLFRGETALVTTGDVRIEFRGPKQTPFDVPFAKCVFEDLTFLPGTVTFQAYGHEIELLPRTLVIDQKENDWRAASIITIEPKIARETPTAEQPGRQ